MEQQHDEQEHEVYGGEIPDEGEMDADVEMSSRAEEDELQDPNSKVCFPFPKSFTFYVSRSGCLMKLTLLW